MPIAHHSVFNNVKSGVVVIDTNNRILELNPEAEKILGEKTKIRYWGRPLPVKFFLNTANLLKNKILYLEFQW